jgi:transposase-like protein
MISSSLLYLTAKAAKCKIAANHEQPAAYMPVTFPNDDAILKVLYLAIINAADKWTRPIQNW